VRAIFDRPSHPYTQALLGSVPRIDAKVARLDSIEGQPPALWDLPQGCRFAPRCPYVHARCRELYPPAFKALDEAPDHTANCWLLEGSA
jgi:oligopeptide/dipeptide ABC transporter ATP-binding protein